MTLEDNSMYSVFFEAQMHSAQDKPIGKVMELSDPDIFPATDDEEAKKISFDKAEAIEYLKSLRIRRNESSKKMLIRVKRVVRICDKETILTPKYKGKFKDLA